MLTSKTELEDIIHGITLGADDYLKKPFAMEELLVRIEALLRRPAAATPLHFEVTPDVVIDMSSHKVSRSDRKPVVLTAKEFGILAYFINHKNKVITQQELYDHVFDFADVQLSNSIEVHIKNVRKKLRTEHYDIPLTTIRGAGYRFDYE